MSAARGAPGGRMHRRGAQPGPAAPAAPPARATAAGKGRGHQALVRLAAATAAAVEARSRPAGVRVGSPCDAAEARAERTAERVLEGSAPPAAAAAPLAFAGRPARAAGLVHGGGEPLAPAERAYFEPRLGRDLSAVRVHRGSGDAATARALGARAFALGPDLVFGAGAYDPGSAAGRRVLAHELAHAAAGEAGPPVLRRLTLAEFRQKLEDTSADHKQVIGELFAHPKFVPLADFLDKCPAGALDFAVKRLTRPGAGGVAVDIFGGFSPGVSGAPAEMSVNPFREEHAKNPLEMVDTIVHEFLHAIIDLGPTCASATNPDPLAGTGITDAPADPELAPLLATGVGTPFSRADVAAAAASGVKTASGGGLLEYFDRTYGPSASRPETHYSDLHRKGLELVTSIITDVHAKFPKIGAETVSFDNVEMFQAEALLGTRQWLNAAQFAFSKSKFKDRVAGERKVDPASYTDREYMISAIHVVEFADFKSFDDNAHGGWGPIGGVWECEKRSRFTGKKLRTVVTGKKAAKPGGATDYKIVQHA